ncbi:hypothetical protein NWFMUON74_68840 [Nocardia wallacei]|uniref:WXG100 family type VII secretion target n=1 Tax=Nocardia wallacei TaxID=480035 RepID=A0A7G1KVK9_9NOCA|nr:hypothetical protein NWFMUON74_68840 [Nocardia wallacei]
MAVGRSLSISSDDARARGTAFQEIGDEVGQVLERLRSVLAEEGRWWGDDESGKAFAEYYEPDARNLVKVLQNLSETLREFGGRIILTAETLQIADHMVARRVELALGQTFPFAAGTSGDVFTAPGRTPTPADVSALSASNPELASRPDSFTSAGAQVAASSFPSAESVPVTSGKAADPTRAGVAAGSRTRPEAVSSGEPAAGRAGRSRPRFVEVAGAKSAATARLQDERRSGTAGASPARNPSKTPWSVGSAPQAVPSGGKRLVVAPDRSVMREFRREDTAAPRRVPGAQLRSGGRPGPSWRPTNRTAVGSDVARLARQLADRHGVEIDGFGAEGIDEVAVREFLSATDHVLTRYPVIDVLVVGIAPLGKREVIRIERKAVDETAESSSGWSVVMNSVVLQDRIQLAEVLRQTARSGSIVSQSDSRPVYASTVREFGDAFDRAGARIACAQAQRALIAEYLCDDTEYRRTDLARVVHGFKRWRDQLSGGSFDRGVFDPAAALAEAFTDVVLNGTAATEPAKTLCRLLIDTARGSANATNYQ